jgi:hypothetical protein
VVSGAAVVWSALCCLGTSSFGSSSSGFFSGIGRATGSTTSGSGASGEGSTGGVSFSTSSLVSFAACGVSVASSMRGPWATSGESTRETDGVGTMSTITELAAASSDASSCQCMSARAVQPTCAASTNAAAPARRAFARDRRQRPAQPAHGRPQLEVLGEPHRPRHERGERQADHDGLDEDVGRQPRDLSLRRRPPHPPFGHLLPKGRRGRQPHDSCERAGAQ